MFKVQRLKFVLLLFTIHYSLFIANGQDVKVIAKIDSSNVIKIGDQLRLHLKAHILKNDHVTWPFIQDTIIKQVEVITRSPIDTSLASDSQHIVLSQTLFITSFDSGYWAIPPFKFLSISGKDTILYETDPLLLQVNTIPVDTTQAIKAIKEPLEIPYDWKDLISKILIALVITLILAYCAWWLWKKRKNKSVVEKIEQVIIIPPHEIALQRLEELKKQQLWQNNQLKEYHALLSEIVRSYLEHRYQFNALEFTTDEIMHSIRNIDIPSEAGAKLRQLLVLSDMAKFAKEQPLPNENELSMSNAIEFVNMTKENKINV
jgi:hypothetical protein